MKTTPTRFSDLEQILINSYESEPTMSESERHAARFLVAQMAVARELSKSDLDARMKKTGVKTLRAALYLKIVQESEKKPTEAQIGAMLDNDSLVIGEQNGFDTAEVDRDELERYFKIFGDAHVYFRGIAKGNFGG